MRTLNPAPRSSLELEGVALRDQEHGRSEGKGDVAILGGRLENLGSPRFLVLVLGHDCVHLFNAPTTKSEVATIRLSLRRDRP